jgi:hypothetical protein
VGEAAVVQAPLNLHSFVPRLAHSGGFDGPPRAVLAYVGIPMEGPAGSPIEAHTLGLEPWGAWPPVLPPSSMLSPIEGQIAIAEGMNADLAALYMTPAGDVVYSPELVAGAPLSGSGLDVATKASPSFLSKQQTGHLLGLGMPYTLPSGASAAEIVVGFASSGASGAPSLDWMVPLGCTQGGAVADAKAVDKGALVAFANGQAQIDLAGCASGVDPSQPYSTQLVVAKITGGNPTFTTLGDVAKSLGQINGLAMAERSDGAWVAWGRASVQGADGSIEAARLDADGHFAAGPWTFQAANDVHSASVGAGRLGDDLVIAWADVSQVPTRVEVRRIDGTGAEVAKGSFEVEDSVLQGIAVLGSPEGDAVLLAYAQWSQSKGIAEIHLRRLGCAKE